MNWHQHYLQIICQQFSWSPIFYGQNSHFCCQNWFFLMFRPTNFLDHELSWSQNFLVNLHSIPMPKFHAQLYSIPILCSTPFHSNNISCSVTISWSVTSLVPRLSGGREECGLETRLVSDSLAPEVSHAFLLTIGVVWVWAFTGNSYNTSLTM